jgi:hypothetical protein
MTMERNTKAKVQRAATSTTPVRGASPKQIREHGRFLPLELGRKFLASCERPTRTAGRTREMVVGDKIKARRGAGRTRVL